jgi:hypothetical protein
MLIYKHALEKDNRCIYKEKKCDVACLKKCGNSLNPVIYENSEFIKFQRCINMTFNEYVNKEHINENIYYAEFETTIDKIKSTIKERFDSLVKSGNFYTVNGVKKIPAPSYVMIAKKIENDNSENILSKITDKGILEELRGTSDKSAQETSLKKFTFKGKYKVILYIPNLMKTKEGYSYFPSLEACSNQNRWMELMVSRYSYHLRLLNNIEPNNIKDGSFENNLFLNEVNNICNNMGCVSDVGEDLNEIIPPYSTDKDQTRANAISKAPYYPTKCLQTQNYKDYMFDETQKRSVEKYIKKAINYINNTVEEEEEEEEEGDPDPPPDPEDKEEEDEDDDRNIIINSKNAFFRARNDVYKNKGKKYNRYMLKDLAKRKDVAYPGVPELTFRMYRINEIDNDFKNFFHYMPWGNILLKQDYVLNDGEILNMDYITKPFKTFDGKYYMKFDSAGILSLFDNNNTKIKTMAGAENINMSGIKNRIIEYSIGVLNFSGKDDKDNIIGLKSMVVNIKDSKKKNPVSIILDPKNLGEFIVYDMCFNAVN